MLKGISPLISMVIVILVSVIGVGIVIFTALPTIDRARDSATINEAIQNMKTLDDTIKEVASEGTGSLRSLQMHSSGGSYNVRNASGVEYVFETAANYIPTRTVVKNGNVKMSTGFSSTGLVGYWNFDQGFGSIANDSSGNGNSGTLVGDSNISWNTSSFCKYGNCLTFYNGTGSSGTGGGVVNISDSNTLDPTSAITLEFWINPASTSTVGIIERSNGGCSASYEAYISSTANFRVWTSSGCVNLTGVKSLSLNQWNHITETYDGSNMKIYVNGQLDNSVSQIGIIVVNSTSLTIGGTNNVAWTLNGSIDEVRIYNRALPQSEIQDDMSLPPNKLKISIDYNNLIVMGSGTIGGQGITNICVQNLGVQSNEPVVQVANC